MSVDAVRDAWRGVGPREEFYRTAQDRLRADWPELASALDALAPLVPVEGMLAHFERTHHSVVIKDGEPGWRCEVCSVRSPAWELRVEAECRKPGHLVVRNGDGAWWCSTCTKLDRTETMMQRRAWWKQRDTVEIVEVLSTFPRGSTDPTVALLREILQEREQS